MAKRSPLIIFLSLLVLVFFFAGAAVVLQKLTGKKKLLAAKEKVGVVEVFGPITDAKTTLKRLQRFGEDKTVKALVIRINSPGGAVGPSQEIRAELLKLREKKKVVASLGTVAASGGYYIASGAEVIMANPGTLTGSIGVIMNLTNVEELLRRLGLEFFNIKAGALKDVGTPFRPMRPEERAYLQRLLNQIHEQFIADVAEGRRLLIHKVREIADGRVMTGAEAKEYGLVDQLGNFQDAVELAGRLAGIKGKVEPVYPPKERPSLLRFLLDEDQEEKVSAWLSGVAMPAYLWQPGR